MALAAHQHLPARGQRPRETVAVADRHRHHPGVGRGRPGAAVADRVAGRHHLEVHDLGHQRHRRPQVHRGPGGGVGQHAEQRDAGPDHVQVGFREMQHAAGVGQVAQRHGRADPFEVGAGAEETFELARRRRRVRIVGAGQVRIDALDVAPARGQRRFDEGPGVVAVNADALHAGVDLQVHGGTPAQGFGRDLDLAQLVDRRHGDFEVVGDHRGRLRTEDAAHHQDRQRHPGAPQRDALLQEGHAQLPGPLRLQVQPHAGQAMAVGIGLDDRHHRHAGVGGQGAQVVRDRVQVHADARGSLAEDVVAVGGGVHAGILARRRPIRSCRRRPGPGCRSGCTRRRT